MAVAVVVVVVVVAVTVVLLLSSLSSAPLALCRSFVSVDRSIYLVHYALSVREIGVAVKPTKSISHPTFINDVETDLQSNIRLF